ncbi:hypothetical protein HIM_10644 [Hirsutella minnesotensis 3608]|uniref:lytic cellulose monooxygenase (C4-dehydrogenating) n=1 Tax=Hirsutella minnesotensis 3608 TaxID=1043627 RepID=A0A0F7ZRP5_9HYPO|nr:hypothetical protein HIM_10644 [Hirsutella minnesotensis 3608]
MSLSKVAWLILGTAALAAAHGHIDRIDIDGKSYGGFLVDQYPHEQNVPDLIAWSTAATQDGPVQTFDYNQPNIICHQDAKPGALAGEVAAGGNVTIHWSKWFEDHRGPVISYLANCNGSCASVNKTELEFFKIEEAGLLDNSKSPGRWASDELMAANNTWTVNIPSDIAAGNYVGTGKTGTGNTGAGKTGTGNTGAGKTGTGNTGAGKTGTGNTGAGKTGTGNTGAGKTGTGNTGAGKTGTGNTGAGKTGTGNTGTGSVRT